MRSIQDLIFFYSLVVFVQGVTIPPSIVEQPDYDVFYKAGETVEMPCFANGIPRPVYTWKRNGIDFNPSGNDDRVVQMPYSGTIVITRPEDKDEGIFQCTAHNNFGDSLTIRINLREAKLKDFEIGPTQYYYPQLGKPLTLNCVPPESIPMSQVFWVLKKDQGGFDAINYDKRVSMDHEYRLRFASVEIGDYMQGRAYACMAMNSIMRKTTQGPLHIVDPRRSSTVEMSAASYMWASPDDHFGLQGDNFTVKCIFAGNPVPDVHWERTNGEPLPDRAKLQSFSQELMIENLKFEDAGTYECWATNTYSQTRAQRTIQVRVESRPYWLAEPQNQEKGEGGSAEFNCLANGIPEPTYNWFVNGVPWESVTDKRIDGRFKRPRPDRIVVTDLTKNDAMVLQCNATNKHGYIWGDVYLNVLSNTSEVIGSGGVRHDVTCGQTEMSFSILLPDNFALPSAARLSDPRCQVDVVGHRLQGRTSLNGCGTKMAFTSNTVLFSNSIFLSHSNHSKDDSVIPIHCTYNRGADLQLSYLPLIRQVLFTEEGVGQFQFQIQQFQDATYSSAVDDASYPLRTNPHQEIFVALSLNDPVPGSSEVPDYGIEVESCIASPLASVTSARLEQYEDLIVDGCPASSSVQLFNKAPISSPVGPQTNTSNTTKPLASRNTFRFSFRSMAFHDPADPSRVLTGLVYIHCHVELCPKARCNDGTACPSHSRKRRSLTWQSHSAGHSLSTGPLLVVASFEEPAMPVSPAMIALSVVAAVASLVAVAVVIAWRRGPRQGQGYRQVKVEDE